MFAAINSFLTRALTNLTDVYWPFVSMLLHGDGTNAAQNNTFLDTSTNNFTVTRNGNTTQGSFNPFTPVYPYSVATNGGSGYFDGTGDYLTVPSNVALAMGTGDFTIECWVNTPLVNANNDVLIELRSTGATSTGFVFNMNPTGVGYQLNFYTDGGFNLGSTVLNYNVWNHVAVTRSGTTVRLFSNGAVSATFTKANNFSDTPVPQIGSSPLYSPSSVIGYISNLRVVKGTAVYTAAFTPPTAPLTAVTNTALLLGMSNGAIYDNTMLNNLETVADAQISTSVFKYGTGALKFNGTTDYLPTPAKTAFNVGAGDFTVECWVYQTAAQNAYIAGQTDTVFTPTNTSLYMYISSLRFPRIAAYNGGNIYSAISSTAISLNTWVHVAGVRDGATLRIYVNGVQAGTDNITTLTVNTSTGRFVVGGSGDNPGQYFNGYIDDFRFTKGICRYPSGTTFTPPTAAFPNQGTTTYPVGWLTQQAIFGFGVNSSGNADSVTNKVSNVGVVSADTTGVGTARYILAAASYGGDKAIFGFGSDGFNPQSMTNKVSNTGVVATDTTGVGTARSSLAAASYGGDKAIFGFGGNSSITNLVSNVGVVATDTTGVGTVRDVLAGVSYGGDKAIFGYGAGASTYSLTNLVSNTGVVASDTTGVGTARYQLAAATYGYTGQAMFGYGYNGSSELSMTNLVANTGVVATDTTGVGTARRRLAAASYGGGNAIFGYGSSAVSSYTSITNLVSAIGIVANDVSSAGTARYGLAAAGYSA